MKKNTLIAVGAVAGAAIFFCLVIAGLIALSITGIASRKVSEDERSRLVTIDTLAEYCTISGERSLCESSVTRHNLDGSLEVEYTYDSSNDPKAKDFLFVNSTAETDRTTRLARETFRCNVGVYKLGTKLAKGVKLEKQPDLFSLGDDNYAANVTRDGKIIGTVVVTRKGKTVYSLCVYGIYFGERDTLESLLGPTMR